MKKINLLFIIIFSTFVSVFAMGYYSSFLNKPEYYEEDKSIKPVAARDEKAYIPKENIINDNQGKVVKIVEEETNNAKEYLESEELENEDLAKNELRDEQKSSENLNQDIPSDIYLPQREDGLENFNYNTKEEEQSVFKVSTWKIEENLTTSDKIKLLYISFQLGKENYKKVEEYLYAVDAEEGVLNALELLKENLSEKEYEKVRIIAGKFIDMDAAERLK